MTGEAEHPHHPPWTYYVVMRSDHTLGVDLVTFGAGGLRLRPQGGLVALLVAVRRVVCTVGRGGGVTNAARRSKECL